MGVLGFLFISAPYSLSTLSLSRIIHDFKTLLSNLNEFLHELKAFLHVLKVKLTLICRFEAFEGIFFHYTLSIRIEICVFFNLLSRFNIIVHSLFELKLELVLTYQFLWETIMFWMFFRDFILQWVNFVILF